MTRTGLAKLTGNLYRLVLEESWQCEKPEVREPDRRWYERIPCKGEAFIYLYCETGENCSLGSAGCLYGSCLPGQIILKLWTPRVKNARFIVKEVPGCLAEWLDGEAVVYFSLELVHKVADHAEARTRKRLSPEARLKAAERGKAALEKYRKSNPQGEKMTL